MAASRTFVVWPLDISFHCLIGVVCWRYPRSQSVIKSPIPGRYSSLPVIGHRFPPLRMHAFDIGPGARGRCLCSLFRERGAVLVRGRSTYHVVWKRCRESKCSKAFETPLSLACAAAMVGCPQSIRRVKVLGPEPRRTEGWTRESYCSKTSSVTLWDLFLAY